MSEEKVEVVRYAWLEEVCLEDGKEFIREPMQWGSSVFATDGRVAVCVTGMPSTYRLLKEDSEDYEKIAKLMKSIQKANIIGKVDMKSLHSFADPSCWACMDAGVISCDECGCEMKCRACKKPRCVEVQEDDQCESLVRTGVVGGKVFDRNRLAMLPRELDGMVNVSLGEGNSPLVLAGKSDFSLPGTEDAVMFLKWKALVMPMTWKQQKSMPVLKLED